MNTRRRRQLLAASVAVVLSCTGDTHVGCSPTLTCTLRPGRFAPPPGFDAGPQTCDLGLDRCAASQVSAGDGHTCVVTDAGSLICWGDDAEGQRGVTLDELSSRRASSISEGFDPENDAGAYLASASRVVDDAKQVATGAAHSCALLEDGRVSCWGRNVEGQVRGPGEAAMVTAPADTGVTGATHIDAGAFHTCAVVEAGVMCWGSGSYGQSGRAQSAAALAPALVPDTETAVEVSCGVRHTCARLSSREVRCWGELIDEGGAPYVTPDATPVPELRALGISAGAGQSCALTEAFAVVCWVSRPVRVRLQLVAASSTGAWSGTAARSTNRRRSRVGAAAPKASSASASAMIARARRRCCSRACSTPRISPRSATPNSSRWARSTAAAWAVRARCSVGETIAISSSGLGCWSTSAT